MVSATTSPPRNARTRFAPGSSLMRPRAVGWGLVAVMSRRPFGQAGAGRRRRRAPAWSRVSTPRYTSRDSERQAVGEPARLACALLAVCRPAGALLGDARGDEAQERRALGDRGLDHAVPVGERRG